MGVPLLRLTKRFLWKQYKDLFGKSFVSVDNWAIGIIQEPATELLNRNTPFTVEWLVPPEGRFYADPFAIVRGDITYVFFEDYDYLTQTGRISVIETKDFKTFSQARPVLEQPFHLSYPYVLEHEGRYYCVPEQCQSGEVAIYEAGDFPEGWVKRATLIDKFPGVDPTLTRYQGRWWMFLGNAETDLSSNLYIYWADDLLGPWTPHSDNPVIAANQLARPGGTPFLWGESLLRPAQDGSRTYGGSLVVNEITTLTKSRFEERVFAQLTPRTTWPYSEGLHTLSAIGNLTVIDGKRFVPVRISLGKALVGKLKAVRRLLTREPSSST